MQLPYEVSLIINKLNKNGYEAFVVGGCVRDSLLGKKPKDFDIATSAAPLEVKAIFPRTVDTGIRHGTVTVLVGKSPVEVTTYRIDGEYTDNRHPKNVVFTGDLKEDLMRRDFTINAMAYHPKLGLTDYYGGKDDITQKIIRGVGNPEKRFEEDALRMLRAIRFAAALGFEIEAATKKAIYKKAPLIQNISCERIRDEFIKTITAPFPEALELLTDTGLLYYFSKELQEYCIKYIPEIIKSLSKCEKDLIYCLVVFFMRMEPEMAQNTLQKLRIDNKTLKEVMTLKLWLDKPLPKDKYETRKMLSIIGTAAYKKLLALRQSVTGENCRGNIDMLNDTVANNDCFSLKDLDINGNDLTALGFTGIAVGEILAAMLDYVMKNPENNKKELLLKEVKTQKSQT